MSRCLEPTNAVTEIPSLGVFDSEESNFTEPARAAFFDDPVPVHDDDGRFDSEVEHREVDDDWDDDDFDDEGGSFLFDEDDEFDGSDDDDFDDEGDDDFEDDDFDDEDGDE